MDLKRYKFKSVVSLLRVDSVGMIDSDFEHVRDWGKLNVSDVDYEYFPRGRVIFDTNIKKHIVYLEPISIGAKFITLPSQIDV